MNDWYSVIKNKRVDKKYKRNYFPQMFGVVSYSVVKMPGVSSVWWCLWCLASGMGMEGGVDMGLVFRIVDLVLLNAYGDGRFFFFFWFS